MQVEGPDTTRNIQIATTVSDRTRILRPHFLMEDAYTSEEVCDLRPSTEYTFSVCAVTVAGSGPAISVSFVTPQEGEASLCTSMFKQCQRAYIPFIAFHLHSHILTHSSLQHYWQI